MPHLAGTPDEIRSRVPAVLAAWEYMRDNVLAGGIVDHSLKELCRVYVSKTIDCDY